MDSLDLVEILMEVEDTFSIDVPDDEGFRFNTVRQVADYVRSQLHPDDEHLAAEEA